MKIVGWCLLALLGLIVLYLLVLWISSLFVRTDRLYTKNNAYYRWLINSVAGIALVFGHVRMDVKGMERLPADQPMVFVCNHRSNYDPVVLEWLLRRRRITFVTKPENFSIFVIGRIARRNCCVPIDRENPRNALTAIKQACDLIEDAKMPVVVFPEGTRSRDGAILPFHNGVLKIATKTKVPVAAFYLDGTERIAKNMPWKRTNVRAEVVDVLSAEEVAEMTTAQMSERIRSIYIAKNGEGVL